MQDTTYDAIEQLVVTNVQKLNSMESTDEGYEKLADATVKMTDKFLQLERDFEESEDRKTKLQIEQEKNDNMVKIEESKSKFNWKYALFEIAKIVIPAGLGYAAYEHFQTRVLDFEENGRISSTAGRELHLPKFMK